MFETVILGGGAAGTGPLVWAAGAGVLDDWLARGVAIVEQRRGMGGLVGHYALNADTLGSTFLECLDGPACHPCLVQLRADRTACALATYRNGLPPLSLVGHFLERIGVALTAEIARQPASRFLPQTRVLGLHLQDDGSVVAELSDPQGRPMRLQAASAVLALGGCQPTAWRDVTLAPGIRLDTWRRKLMQSDQLLARGGATLAAARLAGRPQPRAVILGGSHSAFSAAWTLLERTPGLRFGSGSIKLLHHSAPRVFYPSRAAAAQDGYAFDEQDVCPATGRVNRLGGLRGDGRALWRRMHGRDGAGCEARAVPGLLASMSPAELAAELDAADLIVPAFGYRLATVPIRDARGMPVALAATGPSVDAEARLRTADGGVLPNVFGIGLGSGFRPWGAMAGEPSFRGQQNSLWLYQHGLGALIHDAVRDSAARRRAAQAAVTAIRDLATLPAPAEAEQLQAAK